MSWIAVAQAGFCVHCHESSVGFYKIEGFLAQLRNCFSRRIMLHVVGWLGRCETMPPSLRPLLGPLSFLRMTVSGGVVTGRGKQQLARI